MTTKSATAYVENQRAMLGTAVQPMWIDVANAYDAGLRHAIENRPNARRQMDDAGKQILIPDCGAKAIKVPGRQWCRVCGEEHAGPRCIDEFPEPGEIRETGR